MPLPQTPASVTDGPAESPCAAGLLAYSAELHPIGEHNANLWMEAGDPMGPPKSDLEPYAAPWGEADAFPVGLDDGRATSSARTRQLTS
jgi:hypothetical protein